MIHIKYVHIVSLILQDFHENQKKKNQVRILNFTYIQVSIKFNRCGEEEKSRSCINFGFGWIALSSI